jgi:hypothetical protein
MSGAIAAFQTMTRILSSQSDVKLDYLRFMGAICWDLQFSFLDIRITASVSTAIASVQQPLVNTQEFSARVFTSMAVIFLHSFLTL